MFSFNRNQYDQHTFLWRCSSERCAQSRNFLPRPSSSPTMEGSSFYRLDGVLPGPCSISSPGCKHCGTLCDSRRHSLRHLLQRQAPCAQISNGIDIDERRTKCGLWTKRLWCPPWQILKQSCANVPWLFAAEGLWTPVQETDQHILRSFFFSFFFPCFLQRGIDARLLSRCFKDIVVKGFCEDGQQMQITTWIA